MRNCTSELCQLLRRLQGTPRELNEGALVTFLNPYTYLFARKHLDVYADFTILIDGILLVHVLRLFGFRSISRQSFDMTSLAPKVFEAAIKGRNSIYFIGARPDEIDMAVKKITHSFPELNIIGFQNGYMDGEDRGNTIQKIVKLNPDIVVCGMGGLKQERFLLDIRNHGWNGVGYTCGGFLRQSARRLDYYPAWADKLHLRWVYRIYDEPFLVKRYFLKYPLSLLLLLVDLIRCRKVWLHQ